MYRAYGCPLLGHPVPLVFDAFIGSTSTRLLPQWLPLKRQEVGFSGIGRCGSGSQIHAAGSEAALLVRDLPNSR